MIVLFCFSRCNYVPLISLRSNFRLTIEFQLLKSDAKLANHLVSVRKAYCLLIDSSIEEQIASSMSFPAAKGFCFWYLHFNLQNHFFLSFSRPRRSTSMMVWNRRGRKKKR